MTEPMAIGEYKCPICGSTARVFGPALEELARKGQVKESGFYCLKQEAIPLANPQTAILTVPVIVQYWDVCKDCGQAYVCKIDRQQASMKYTQRGKGGQAPFSLS